jgi:hypothetical protein
MSDANVDHEASGLFGLTTTSGFYPQDSGEEEGSDEKLARGATANMVGRNIVNAMKTFSNRYVYVGATLRTSLGATATAFGSVVGTGAAAKIVTGLSISFPDGGAHAELTITGHSHTTNNHSATTNPPRTFSIAALIPLAAGLGVPNILGGTVVNTSCSPVSGGIDFSINHVDKPGATGSHFTGENISCRAEASLDFEGVCGAAAGVNAAWAQPLRKLNDQNEDLDTSALTAHADVDHN